MDCRSRAYSKTRHVPDREVSVGVVDERRETAVRIELGVFGPLVLALGDVDCDSVVLEAELLEDNGDLPVNRGTSVALDYSA